MYSCKWYDCHVHCITIVIRRVADCAGPAGTDVCVIDQAPGHVSSTVLTACAANNTFITRTAIGYQHFFHSFFLFLYFGSKSGPYRVILDQLSGQYREIWTGLGCLGLASCMTTVTCRVMNMFRQPVKGPKPIFLHTYINTGLH